LHGLRGKIWVMFLTLYLRNDFEIGYSVSFIMSCSALNLLRYLDLLAAYLENPDSHRHEDVNGRSFLVAKLAVCRNPSFRSA
jgi:hypothetical protein